VPATKGRRSLIEYRLDGAGHTSRNGSARRTALRAYGAQRRGPHGHDRGDPALHTAYRLSTSNRRGKTAITTPRICVSPTHTMIPNVNGVEGTDAGILQAASPDQSSASLAAAARGRVRLRQSHRKKRRRRHRRGLVYRVSLLSFRVVLPVQALHRQLGSSACVTFAER